MSVSYVVPCYGKPGLLTACLSTFRKFHPTDKMMVVDDGGPDASEIEAICTNYNAVYVRKENGGFSSACNLGVSKSTEDLACLVNSDIQFTCRLTERIERAFVRDNKIAVVGALLLYPDGRIQHGGGYYGGVYPEVYRWHETMHLGYQKWPHQAKLCSIPAYRFFVTGALMALDKTKAPTFDETIISDSEDGDLCLKAWEKGLRVLYDPSITAIHDEGKTRGATVQEKIQSGNYQKGEKARQEFLNRMYNADMEGITKTINGLNRELHPKLPRAFMRSWAVGDVLKSLPVYDALSQQEDLVVITHCPEAFRDRKPLAITKSIDEFATSSFIDLNLAYERHRDLSIENSYWSQLGVAHHETLQTTIQGSAMDWMEVRRMVPEFDWERPYVVVHMGVGWPSKTMPPNFYGQIIQAYLQMGYNVVLVGTNGRDNRAQGPGILDMLGRTNLHQLRAICEHAKLFIGPDSGPLHVADGACPAIGLFTITTPEKTVSPKVTGIMTKAECKGCLLRQPTACWYECDHAKGTPMFQHCVMMFDPKEIVEKGLELMGVKN